MHHFQCFFGIIRVSKTGDVTHVRTTTEINFKSIYGFLRYCGFKGQSIKKINERIDYCFATKAFSKMVSFSVPYLLMGVFAVDR